MSFLKKNKELILSICALVLVMGGTVIAGEITSSSEPVTTMYTLSDIYYKLNVPTYTPGHNLGPGYMSTSSPSYFSLEDVYNAVPASKVLDNSTTTIETGIYATTTLSDIEPNLKPENIASGTAVFGIMGTFDCAPIL